MDFNSRNVNPAVDAIYTTDLNTPPVVTTNPKNRLEKNILKIGVPQIEANLLYSGIVRGKILNIDVAQVFAPRAVAFFTSKIANAGCKIAVAFDETQYQKGTQNAQKYAKPNLLEKFHQNVFFWGVPQDIPPNAILEKAKNESIDCLLLCDFWYRTSGKKGDTRVRDLAEAVSKTNVAVIVLSQVKYPTWLSNYRTDGSPAQTTLLKYCQCAILIRPILGNEKNSVNESFFEGIRWEIRNSASNKIPSEILFAQRDETGFLYKRTLNCTYARGYKDRPHSQLGFSFESPNGSSEFPREIKVATLC